MRGAVGGDGGFSLVCSETLQLLLQAEDGLLSQEQFLSHSSEFSPCSLSVLLQLLDLSSQLLQGGLQLIPHLAVLVFELLCGLSGCLVGEQQLLHFHELYFLQGQTLSLSLSLSLSLPLYMYADLLEATLLLKVFCGSRTC